MRTENNVGYNVSLLPRLRQSPNAKIPMQSKSRFLYLLNVHSNVESLLYPSITA